MAATIFAELARLSADPPGVTRASFSREENAAHALVASIARQLGMEVVQDGFGNSFASLPGHDERREVLIGSHLDSVQHGGNYDGAAGVVAGLVLARRFVQAGRRPPLTITVAAIRAEESVWFPSSYLGSRAALGHLQQDDIGKLRRSDTGRSLRSHMQECNLQPEQAGRQYPAIAEGRVAAFVEPHIEQGPVMEARAWPIAAVTTVAGSIRYRAARCLGQQGHSGAVPHGYRSDAVVGAAALVLGLNRLQATLAGQGHELTVTIGQLYTDAEAHAFSKIAGLCTLAIDVRSPSEATLGLADDGVVRCAREVEKTCGIRVDLGQRTGSTPVRLDAGVHRALRWSLQQIGLPDVAMASGAGHDAAHFQAAGIPAGMLFIRNANGSHNPDEQMSMEDFDCAVKALSAFVDGYADAR